MPHQVIKRRDIKIARSVDVADRRSGVQPASKGLPIIRGYNGPAAIYTIGVGEGNVSGSIVNSGD